MSLYLLLFSSLSIFHLFNGQEMICNDQTGHCLPHDEVDAKIPKYASQDGRATHAPVACFDRHPDCDFFVSEGECSNNPGWMIINCPAGCQSCHLRDSQVRCSRSFLNISETNILQPNSLNQIFERILEISQNNPSTVFGSGTGQVNILSRDPWILEFEDLLSPLEVETLIGAVHENQWERSTDTGQMNQYGEQGRILSSSRTSSNAWCRDDCESNPIIAEVIHRLEHITTVPQANYESFQILRYEPNQYYRAHHDTGSDEDQLPCGMRILTFFLYLSDVEEGGETAFPLLNLKVQPKLGKGILWPGVKNENPQMIDWRTRHEARPVVRGMKYAANSWIHSHNFRLPNLWGCTGAFD
jgi:prolyl 4-hydroxylase